MTREPQGARAVYPGTFDPFTPGHLLPARPELATMSSTAVRLTSRA